MEEGLQAVRGSSTPGVGSERVTVGEEVEPLAFEEFFAEESKRLFQRMCFVTGNAQEAEEIMQDAFLSLWERWEHVRDLEDPTGYLYRTAMNAFRKRYRRAALALRRALGEASSLDPFAEIDERQDLLAALGALSRRQRAALVLLDVVDMTSEEAGRALGVAPGTVRSLATRARAAVRESLEGKR
jgi:RNA polymerase sigma factor (sigma-70 family)